MQTICGKQKSDSVVCATFAAQSSSHVSFARGGLLFRYFWHLCKEKLQHPASSGDGCSRARGTSQGDERPKKQLCPCHDSPKPCQKPHPCQHRSKQPELAAFASNQSNSPLLRSKLPAQGSTFKVQPCLHAPFL